MIGLVAFCAVFALFAARGGEAVDCTTAMAYGNVYRTNPCRAVMFPGNCPERKQFSDLGEFIGTLSTEIFPDGCTFYISQYNTTCMGEDRCFQQQDDPGNLTEYVYDIINIDVPHSNSIFLPAYKGSRVKFRTNGISAEYVGSSSATCSALTFLGKNNTIQDMEVEIMEDCYIYSKQVRGLGDSGLDRAGFRFSTRDMSNTTVTNVEATGYATAALAISESGAPIGNTVNVENVVLTNISVDTLAGTSGVSNISLFGIPVTVFMRSAVGEMTVINSGNIIYDQGSPTFQGNGTETIAWKNIFLDKVTSTPASSSSDSEESRDVGDEALAISISMFVGFALLIGLVWYCTDCSKNKKKARNVAERTQQAIKEWQNQLRSEKKKAISEMRTLAGPRTSSSSLTKTNPTRRTDRSLFDGQTKKSS